MIPSAGWGVVFHYPGYCPASFHETCHWLKFPLNGLRAQSRVSPVVGLLLLASDDENDDDDYDDDNDNNNNNNNSNNNNFWRPMFITS